MAAFFGIPRLLDGGFFLALRTFGTLDCSVNSLSPGSSAVVSSSPCLAPSPMFSLMTIGPDLVGERTGITMGKLACSASPLRVRWSAYIVICQFLHAGVGIMGIVETLLGGLGVSAILIVWGVMGTHCFLSSSSASMSSMSQSHAM